MTYLDAVCAFFLAAAFSFSVTPLTAFFAKKLNFLDSPSSKKVHARPTPLLGGLAIYFAFIFAISLTVHSDNVLIGMLVGGTVVMVIGVIDDKYGMLPRIKLLGQFTAAVIAVLMGVKVVFIKVPLLSVLFTCFWLVAMTNAFNLLDNINGLCAGVSSIAAFFFGLLALIQGQMMIAIVSFGLAGACLGFLKHNFPKADIFMGDAGSMFLGYTLASIAVAGSWETSSVTTSLAIPVLILGYPIFDVTLVTVMRLAEGRPISKGGTDHSSHRFAIAIMESIRGSRSKRGRPAAGGGAFGSAVVEFMKGLKKKGEDRAMNRLANLGFKKKRAVLILYGASIALGMAALGMTVLGKYFDWSIMIVSFLLLALFGIRLSRVPVNSIKR